MTNKILISDNASTTLAAGIAANSPSMQVVSGAGALFPVLGANQAFVCTLVKSGAPTIREVVLVQGHTSGSDNFTSLVRNLSGTGALAWNAGDIVEMRPTAETFANFAQFIDLQAQQTNYAIDIGIANSYAVNLSPALNGHVIGMPIRWKAANTNTGPSLFNDGSGVAPLISPGGSQLIGSDVIVGGIYTAIWDGTNFQHSQRRFNFQQISGSISNSQVPVGAVIQWESSLVIAFSQLTGQLQNGQIASSIALPGSPTTTTQSIADVSTKIATTAFVNPSSVLGSYRKEPDGNIAQWGLCNPNGGTISVTFPIAFPTACDNLVFGQISGGATQAWSPTGSVSRTGFQVGNSGGQTYWRARGH